MKGRLLIPPRDEERAKGPVSGCQRKAAEASPDVIALAWRGFAGTGTASCPAECGASSIALVVHADGVYRFSCPRCTWRTEWFEVRDDHVVVLEGYEECASSRDRDPW